MDFNDICSAHQTVRRDLLAERTKGGSWEGRLSSSALAAATAVSALSIYAENADNDHRLSAIRQVAARGIQWLSGCQNADGGWGDTERSFSNIATTMLVEAAFHLAGAAQGHAEAMIRAERYVELRGGIAGLRRRYGRDKTFAVPILMNCALAGMVSWSQVASLPFELACMPHWMLKFLRLPVVSYAIPALVAVGQARYLARKPWNPILAAIRHFSIKKSLAVLEKMQPASGGFLEAIPLTSFVVMALAGTRRAEHPVVRQGVKFLLATQRPDGAWPIDTNLAVWNTTLAINALAATSGDVGALGCLDWLLGAQQQDIHPFTQAAPGGWGWTDLSGAVPDADDTPGALLALAVLRNSGADSNHDRIDNAATAGVRWLLEIQNDDGGWPTFCKGWGALPFDRSACDLTAHAIRALYLWRQTADRETIHAAIERGFDFLATRQRKDGSWLPLWFGNQHRPGEENPVYGTSRVLLAYRDLGRLASEPARRGLRWLAANRCSDGGWGGPAEGDASLVPGGLSSVEETSVALEALLAGYGDLELEKPIAEGLGWLLSAISEGRHKQGAPIGLYFAKLWYHEKIYPLVFALSALGQALRCCQPGEGEQADAGRD